ncbi:hypothetical protein SUGI_1142200 [Cryptomeria japonica]|nr:hypothetical protein SUGI_1142200 [Cryptomeria japonica]
MAVVDYHSLPRKELQNLCKKNGIPANKTNSFMVDALTSILKVDKPEVDYYSLPRKELQNLCKKHGIPANKTNSFMADALTSILKVDKPNEFVSATPTTLPEDAGNTSISSILKIHNNREDFTASKCPYESTFFSLEIQSQRKEPIEEDAIPSTVDTHTEEFTGENPKTKTATIDNSNTNKTSEAENVLLYVASLGTDDRKELFEEDAIPSTVDIHTEEFTGENPKTETATMDNSNTTKTSEAEKVLLYVVSLGTDDRKFFYHHANQQIESGPDTPIALYEDALEELCQQAKFITRKGDKYSLCCTSSSSLCKDMNDRLDNDTKTYSHDEQTTVNVQRVDHWGQEELCQQAKFVTRIGDEYSSGCTSISYLCKDVNDRLDHDEQTTVDMQRLDRLGQEKHCQQSKIVTNNVDEESLHCTSNLSPCSVVNVGDTHEGNFSPGNEERSIHVEGVDLLSQEKEIYMRDHEENDIDPAVLYSCERLKNHHDSYKNSQRHIDIDDKKDLFAMETVIDDETVKHDQPCNQPPFCRGNDKEIDIDDRKDLFEKEMAIDDETVKHGQPCNQPLSCRGNDEVKKSMVKIQTAEVSNKSSSCQLFVCPVNGNKQFVDLENSSSSEWMKTHNCELSELKSASCKTICKVDVTAESRKIKSDKLTDFQPPTSDFERFSDQNPTTCSSKFLGSQNFGSILPFTKKLDVCRERRRTSSFLIPPHGANRGLSSFMTKKSSRLSYTFISPKNTINVSFSSPSAIGDSHKSVSTQVNCSSENSWPIKAAPSKVPNFSIKLGTPEKEVSLAKYHPNTKIAYSIDEPASPHAFVEAVSAMTPIKDGCQDVEMLDQELHYYSTTESLQNKADNEHIFRLAEDYRNSDKKVESVSQMNFPHNSQKQMRKKSLLQDLQSEESRRISRYKDDYKKSPFTKCLRGMNKLAIAATLRADILARKRGLPLVGNSSAYSQSTSAFHDLPYQSQNVQEKNSQDRILRGETGNENGASPQVYRETDQCVSSIKGYESEDPAVFPSVYEDRTQSVSHFTLGKDPMHSFCNIAMPLAHNGPVITSVSAVLPRDEALQSNSIIRESNSKLSKRQYSEISPLAHQEKLISVYGLIPGKDLVQNIGNISASLALVGPVMTHVSTGIEREERQNNNTKLLGQSFQPLAKKQFFEKDLVESTESPQYEADNEHNFCLAEDYQNSDKKIESVSQMNCPHNYQKQMHKKSLLQDLQAEENRKISRYRDDYKKSPFTKCLRSTDNLARAATIRADILARRRGITSCGK